MRRARTVMSTRSIRTGSPLRRIAVASVLLVAGVIAGAGAAPAALGAQGPAANRTDPLLSLFTEWRAFEEPPRVNGVPDYTPATNARRLARLRLLQQRLRAIDTSGWSIAEQVDHHLVRAEMNGMQYSLTVLTPWSRDPLWSANRQATRDAYRHS